MFYSIDLLSPKGALGNVWVMMLLFRDAVFVRVGSLITRSSFLIIRASRILRPLLRVFKKTCGFASADDDETFSLSL
jgi:hypothetical protein